MTQKILHIEPNLDNNGIIPNEDLTIYVSLETIRKGRSIISIDTGGSVGTLRQANGDTRPIKFIEGSESGKGRSLTTRYTDYSNTNDINKDDDYESLGIESIDIQFDTAYTPLIKIKFVDVRGQAILQRGSESKYSMFFELPYPIFELTVKGFYGQAVTYCLHLHKWNSKFNAQTGNFEIDCDFIGYTYAILTDMLLGLIRACVYTPAGEKKFDRVQKEYAAKGFNLKTIDDFLDDIGSLGNLLDKITQDDQEVQEINLNIDIRDELELIKETINTNIKNVFDEEYFSTSSGIIVVPSEKYKKSDVEAVFRTLKENLTNSIGEKNTTDEEKLNYKIGVEKLKIDLTKLTNFVNTFSATTSAVTVTELINIQKSYNTEEETKEGGERYQYVQELVDTIKTRGSGIPANSKINIYDLRDLYTELNKVDKSIQQNEKQTRERVAEKLRNLSFDELGFDPSVENIFTILTTHCEIFLELLYDVSVEAEKSLGRKNELNKIFSKNKKNFNYKDDSNFFPWPEYRESDGGNKGFFETWLGAGLSRVNGNPEKVEEIVFVEEMLEALLKIAKRDDQAQIGEEGISGPQFYPVSSIDSVAGRTAKNLTDNPYVQALTGPRTKNHPDEATRCLMMRGFLGLGVNNFNNFNQYGGNLPKKVVEFMGFLEADNLFQALLPMKRAVARNIIKAIDSIGGSNVSAEVKAKALIDFWREGSSDIINPPGYGGVDQEKVPLLYEFTRNSTPVYRYGYITDRSIPIDDGGYNWCLPISGIFDGRDFYEENSIDGKFNSPEKMLEVASKVDFTSNSNFDDSAIRIAFITENEYNGNAVAPTYASEVGELITAEYIEPVIADEGQFIKQITSIDVNYNLSSNKYLEPLLPYNGRYFAQEYFTLRFTEAFPINYAKIDEPTSNSVSSSVQTLFFYQKDEPKTYPVGNPIYGKYYNTLGGTYLAAKGGGRFNQYTDKIGTKEEIIKNTIYNIEDPEHRFIPWLWNEKPYSQKYKDTHSLSEYGTTKTILTTLLGENEDRVESEITIPFIEFGVGRPAKSYDFNTSDTMNFMSLFGSRFYDIQDAVGKAFLFLHTIPWAGVTDEDGIFQNYATGAPTTDANATLKGLFKFNGGFIKSPYLWCAFIGGLLKRYESNFKNNTDILKWTKFNPNTGIDEAVIPGFGSLDKIDYRNYLKVKKSSDAYPNDRTYFGMDIDDLDVQNHVPLDAILRILPLTVKNEFISIFDNFVLSSEWQFIRDELELRYENNAYSQSVVPERKWEATWDGLNSRVQRLVPGTPSDPNTGQPENGDALNYDDYLIQQAEANLAQTAPPDATNTVYTDYPEHESAENDNTLSTPPYVLKNRDISELLGENVLKNYEMVSPTGDQGWTSWGKAYQYNLTLREGTQVQATLRKLFSKSLIINNLQPGNFNGTAQAKYLEVEQDKFIDYLSGFFTRFNDLKKKFDEEQDNEKNELKQKIFNTIDNDLIKLQLYRTFSSIYNKWIGGTDGKFFTQCGYNQRDESVGEGKRSGGDGVRLIDSFRFLDRAFNYIGDIFYMNPLAIDDLIRHNYNQSFFDLSNRILSDNNFNFIPLPTFVNFNDEQELRDMFKPFPYIDKNKITGPSFVCVYAGQTSTNLDLGSDSTYPDDGWILNIDKDGNVNPEDIPEDFGSDIDLSKGELRCPVISVSYGKQNQSYFKDIKLDQREFTETMESLEIIEDIANGANGRKGAPVGQNLFNIYQTRSYTTEIEMMGCALMQPMMYFNLRNIPMFRGMYLIFKVSHRITPHNMTTSFKGNRVKKTKTALMDAKTLYMNLLGSIEDRGPSASSLSGGGALTSSQASTLQAMRTVDQSTIDALDFGNPFDGNPVLTSPIGPRDAGSNASVNHKGVDIGTTVGTEIKMIGAGEVELVRLQQGGGYGLYMITKHTTPDGKVYRALYAHLSGIDKSILDLDNLTSEQKSAIIGGGLLIQKSVSKGRVIAKSGGGGDETGNINGYKFNGSSTGPHLHFEIKEQVRDGGPGFNTYYFDSNFKDPLLFIPYGYNNPKYAPKRYSPHDDTNDEVSEAEVTT